MKRAFFSLAALFMLGAFSASSGGAEGGGAWGAPDRIFGQTGKDLPGGVHRYGWPRSDLHVTLAGVTVEPALALGSWAAFQSTGSAGKAMAMGDLVLLGSEVEPVIRELQAASIDVLAVHNHLVDESPRLMYVHFEGHADAGSLATALKRALAKTSTPVPAPTPGQPTAEESRAFEQIQSVIGRKGSLAGRVLQVGVPRAEKIEEGGLEIPPAMGMATSMNFQLVGTRVATTGDFVLTASEVNPVIRELEAHGIAVTALHSHMLAESPRLFFMHFWGVGSPEQIGQALKVALSKSAVK
jgi:hypothetical protein